MAEKGKVETCSQCPGRTCYLSLGGRTVVSTGSDAYYGGVKPFNALHRNCPDRVFEPDQPEARKVH